MYKINICYIIRDIARIFRKGFQGHGVVSQMLMNQLCTFKENALIECLTAKLQSIDLI